MKLNSTGRSRAGRGSVSRVFIVISLAIALVCTPSLGGFGAGSAGGGFGATGTPSGHGAFGLLGMFGAGTNGIVYAADPLPTDPLTITVKTPDPKTIQVTWYSDSPTYRIYFGKGTDAKKAPLYKTINTPKDNLGTPIKQYLTETITIGVEDNTTYSLWVEEQAITGKTTSQVPYTVTTPKWDVKIGSDAPVATRWLWYDNATLTATSITFTVLHNPDPKFSGKVELYCSEKSSGAGKWYVGSFSPAANTKYTVKDLEPNTGHYFWVRKGNSWSNWMYVATKAASLAAPTVGKVSGASASITADKNTAVAGKRNLYIESPVTNLPIWAGSVTTGQTKAVGGLIQGTSYRVHETVDTGKRVVKSEGTSFVTTSAKVTNNPNWLILGIETGNFSVPADPGAIYHLRFTGNFSFHTILKKPSVKGYNTISDALKGASASATNESSEYSVGYGQFDEGWYESRGKSSGSTDIDTEWLTNMERDVYSSGDINKAKYLRIRTIFGGGTGDLGDNWIIKNPNYGMNPNTIRETKTTIFDSAQTAGVLGYKPLKTIGSLKASNKETSSVKLSWKNGNKKYPVQIFKAYSKAGPYTYCATAKKGATSATIKGLEPGTTYYFRVYHVDGKTNTSKSAKTVKAATKKTTPTNVSISAVKFGSFKVNWKSPRGSGSKQAYTNVYLATEKGGPFRLYTTVHGKTSATVSGLTMLTNYYVKLEDAEKTASGYWRASAQTGAKHVATIAKTNAIDSFSGRSKSAGAVLGKTEMYVDLKVIHKKATDGQYDAHVYYSYDGKTWMYLANFGKKNISDKRFTLKKRTTYFYAAEGIAYGAAAVPQVAHFSKPTATITVKAP